MRSDSLSRAENIIYNRRKRQGLPLRDPGEPVAVEPVFHMPAPSSPHALHDDNDSSISIDDIEHVDVDLDDLPDDFDDDLFDDNELDQIADSENIVFI